MAEFLLELLSEEIPARMQQRACNELRSGVLAILDEAKLSYGQAKTFSTPRRLCLVIDHVDIEQSTRRN